MVWDNTATHENEKIDPVLWGAAGRLALLDLPTYIPWLNPIEMLRRQFQREVTHYEQFDTDENLLTTTEFLPERYNHCAGTVRSINGAHPT